MRRFVLIIAAVALAASAAFTQTSTSALPRQVKSGDVIQLNNSLTIKITQPAKSPFAAVKMKGEPVVVTLELDGGAKPLSMSYKLSADSKSSDIYLTGGATRIGPSAVVEDFPSWGKDNDKEVEVLDAKANSGGGTLDFEGKGSISLLFDVPPALSKAPKKVSIILRTLKPVDQLHSIVVTL
jgi:hypothetical protein